MTADAARPLEIIELPSVGWQSDGSVHITAIVGRYGGSGTVLLGDVADDVPAELAEVLAGATPITGSPAFAVHIRFDVPIRLDVFHTEVQAIAYGGQAEGEPCERVHPDVPCFIRKPESAYLTAFLADNWYPRVEEGLQHYEIWSFSDPIALILSQKPPTITIRPLQQKATDAH